MIFLREPTSYTLHLRAGQPRIEQEMGSRLTCAIVLSGLLASPAVAGDDLSAVLAFRNHHPFLQIFGVPVFQSATLAEQGRLKYDFNFELTNHADRGGNANEIFEIDGETYALNLSLRHRLWPRLEIGADIPVVSHQKGFLDNIIKEWHDVLSVSNSNRSGPKDQLFFFYEAGGVTQYQRSTSTVGFGDVQLTAAVPLMETNGNTDFTVRTSLKLPTGDDEKLHGSGALDASVGLYASTKTTFLDRGLGLSGFAGLLALGDGDVLPDIQESTVPFGGAAARWQAMERLGIVIQVYAQGNYFDTDVEELGGDTFQLGIGLDWHMPEQGLLLTFAIAEDPLSDATPDFAAHISVRSSAR